MPRYRVTRTERTFHDIDCANPDQAVEIAFTSDTLDTPPWRPGNDGITVTVTEIGAGENDAEAHREALAALASMNAPVAFGGAR